MKNWFPIPERFKSYAPWRRQTLIVIATAFLLFSVISALYISSTLSQGKSYKEYVSNGSVALNQKKVQTISSQYPHCYNGTGTQSDEDFCLQETIDYSKTDLSICHAIETSLWRKMCYINYFQAFPSGFMQYYDGHKDGLNFLFLFGIAVLALAFTETMLASGFAVTGFILIFIIMVVTNEIDSTWACEGVCLPKIIDWGNSFLPMITITLFTFIGFMLEKYILRQQSEILNWKHPEITEKEILIGNYTQEEFENKIMWATKRRGTTPYDKSGVMLTSENLYPVFVNEKEIGKIKDSF